MHSRIQSIDPDIRPVDTRIRSVAVPGFPIVTSRALRTAGIDRNALTRRRADGRLVEVMPRTFLIGIPVDEAPPDLLIMAAIASAGPDAALAGTSALARHSLWNRDDGTIHVVSTTWRVARNTPPVVYHRREQVGTPSNVGGVPTEDPYAALLTAASMLTSHQIAFVINGLTYSHRCSIDEVEGRLAMPAGHRAASRLRRAFELARSGSAGTRCRVEDVILPQLARQFEPPFVNVRGCAGIPEYEPDFCCPRHRLIVEIDGDQHTTSHHAQLQDAERDHLLRVTGWSVVRIPWRRVWEDPASVIAAARDACSGQLPPRDHPASRSRYAQ